MNKISAYILLVIFSVSCTGDNENVVSRSSIVMGSSIEVQIRNVNRVKADKAINLAFAEARRIDTLFSTYLTGNPMWKINNSSADQIIIDDEIFEILEQCDTLWKISNGAFDPAMGNLIELIGFDRNDPKLPKESEIKKVLESIGWKKIKLVKPNVLIKPADVKLSFNACVPGYAADKIANLLYNYGVKEFLVNVGGEIFASGNNWKIGIQHPRKDEEILAVVQPDKYAVATSGDYEQYFTEEGKRFTHIFNPVTGQSASECASVTIICKNTMWADALSTAVFVLGIQKGLELIEQLENVEGIIIDTEGNIYKSSNFEEFIQR
jgi:thiamine biosynthesis lipoprotein